jgi:hypothetical protein
VKSESWTDRTTAEERSAWSVQVEKWELLMKAKRDGAPAQQQASAQQQAPAARTQPDWTSSDSLPF